MSTPLKKIEWETFVQAYAKCGNGRAAYHAAYPTCKDSTADNQASKLLKRPQIRARLAEIQGQAASETIKAIADQAAEIEKNAKDAATLCAIASESLIAMANGDAWDVVQEKKDGAWVDVKRTYRSDVRRSAAETVLKMYGSRQQETIRVELVGDVAELAD